MRQNATPRDCLNQHAFHTTRLCAIEVGAPAWRPDLSVVLCRVIAGIELNSPGSIAPSRVDHVAPAGVADIVVTPEHEWVLTSTIEAPRMREEELAGTGIEVLLGSGSGVCWAVMVAPVSWGWVSVTWRRGACR